MREIVSKPGNESHKTANCLLRYIAWIYGDWYGVVGGIGGGGVLVTRQLSSNDWYMVSIWMLYGMWFMFCGVCSMVCMDGMGKKEGEGKFKVGTSELEL